AWCLLRQAVRTFRLDRISGLEILDRPVEHDVTVLDEPVGAFLPDSDDALVTVEFDAAAEHLAAGYRPVAVERGPGETRMTMQVGITAPSTLRRLLAELPGATVTAPAAARAAVRAWAADALGRYRGAGQ